MCLVAKGLFLISWNEPEILPQPDCRLATPTKKIQNLFPGRHFKGAGPEIWCYNFWISSKKNLHHE